ncbi:twitching motility protein PilT [Halodesulfurarchaeum formicicum]|uniref:Ribonuclease VapC n=1 Tax=Halodesulfurarchaeum formicicum TaxID=1873524 RepID=A0A1D8S3X2_9EURY|nr:PIN domain-containing protein [Halodesulfurarchaeum formicicum]AOW80056.1 twitching motility protein PilT [Halodesulfurarchaeum formicicum]APE95341.1 twitching motility protein PilT [Halodesulfurarchaeum formicicum]
MRPFLDTNILVAAVTDDTDRSSVAVTVLNRADEPYTSILCLMELRSVLSKKKGFERDRVDRIEARIASRTTVTFPDASDIIAANDLQSETLLYPMDALVLAAADASETELVSFDTELVEHGALTPSVYLAE